MLLDCFTNKCKTERSAKTLVIVNTILSPILGPLQIIVKVVKPLLTLIANCFFYVRGKISNTPKYFFTKEQIFQDSKGNALSFPLKGLLFLIPGMITLSNIVDIHYGRQHHMKWVEIKNEIL